jgi:hypothetical protein
MCFDEASIGGDTMLKRGTQVKFWWNYKHCQGEPDKCSEFHSALEEFGNSDLVIMIFVQEVFIDFNDY